MAADEGPLPFWFEPGRKRPDGSGIDMHTTKNVKWVAQLGTENYSSPVIAAGRVLIGTNDMLVDDSPHKPSGGGLLLCLDEATGKVLWRFVCPKLETDREHVSSDYELMSLGICSTPTVEENRVYLVTNRCEVVCLDLNGMADGNGGPFTDEAHYALAPGETPHQPTATDADILWRFDMLHEAPSFPHDAANCSVSVHGEFLYVGTSIGVNMLAPPGQQHPFADAPSLIVLDKRTGKLVAKEGAGITARVFHGQWSSPSLGKVGDKTLVFYGGGDGVCYAFEALTGDCPSFCLGKNGTVPLGGGGKGDSPIFAGAKIGTVPVARIGAVPVASLKTAWSFDCNPPELRIKDDKPIGYWDGDKRKNPANKNDGQFLSPSEIIATPVFHDGRVYVAIGQDPLHGRGKGVLHCIDAAKTGDITARGKLWSYEFERSLSTVSIAGGLLFVADYPGRLHCLDLQTGRPCWVHDTQSDVWSSTLVADGKVYLGTRKGLWVFAAAKEEKALAQISLGSPIRSSPVAANGTLYVASQRYLWAINDEGSGANLSRK
jgi:outer membrane protein assembly factor BamB